MRLRLRAGLHQPRVRARRLRRELFVHVQRPPLQRDGAGAGCTMSTAASSASTTACSGTASTARPRPILSPANPRLESLACGAGGVALPARPLRRHVRRFAPRLHLVAAGGGGTRGSVGRERRVQRCVLRLLVTRWATPALDLRSTPKKALPRKESSAGTERVSCGGIDRRSPTREQRRTRRVARPNGAAGARMLRQLVGNPNVSCERRDTVTRRVHPAARVERGV